MANTNPLLKSSKRNCAKVYKTAAMLGIVLTVAMSSCGAEDEIPVYAESGADEASYSETETETATETAETTLPQIQDKINALLSDTTEIDDKIESVFNKHGTVGMSVAVFANGDVIYTNALGYAVPEEGIKVTDDTKYRSASISKTVTAVCAMTLRDEGRLDPYASVSSVLGLKCEADPEHPNEIRHLMTHTSTIFDTMAYVNGTLGKPPHSLESVLANGVFENVLPGTRYHYSNFGFGIMAAVIETITNERFYLYADRVIFDKLGVDAGYNRSMIDDVANIANIYSGGTLSESVRTWGRSADYYNSYSIGGQYADAQCELIISAPDLAKIGIVLAGNGTYKDIRIISEESLAEMKTPMFTVDDEEGFMTSYGYGLRMCDDIVEGRTIIGHPGQAFGMVGGLYFDSSDGTGVAILTNGCSIEMGEAGMYAVNYDIVTAVYDYFFE